MIYRYNLSFVSILQTGSRWLVEVLAQFLRCCLDSIFREGWKTQENVEKKGMDELLLDGIVQLATTLNKIVGMGRYEMARAQVHKFIAVRVRDKGWPLIGLRHDLVRVALGFGRSKKKTTRSVWLIWLISGSLDRKAHRLISFSFLFSRERENFLFLLILSAINSSFPVRVHRCF